MMFLGSRTSVILQDKFFADKAEGDESEAERLLAKLPV